MTEDDWIAVREDAYSTARALGFALIGAVAGALGLIFVAVLILLLGVFS